MVAGGRWLGHPGDALGTQAGQQDTGLDLRAGHGHDVVDRPEWLTGCMYHQRRTPLLGVDARAHQGQGVGHPPHGPTREAFVADERGRDAVARKQTTQQTHGRAAVAAI